MCTVGEVSHMPLARNCSRDKTFICPEKIGRVDGLGYRKLERITWHLNGIYFVKLKATILTSKTIVLRSTSQKIMFRLPISFALFLLAKAAVTNAEVTSRPANPDEDLCLHLGEWCGVDYIPFGRYCCDQTTYAYCELGILGWHAATGTCQWGEYCADSPNGAQCANY